MDIEYGVKTENKFSIVNTLDDEALDPSDILKRLASINAKDDKNAQANKKKLQQQKKSVVTGVSTKTGQQQQQASTGATKVDNKLIGGKAKESTDKENKLSGSSSSGVSRNAESAQKRFARGGAAPNSQSPRNRLPRQERSNIPPRFRQPNDGSDQTAAFQNGGAQQQQFGGNFGNRGGAFGQNEEPRNNNSEDTTGMDNSAAAVGQPGFGTGFGGGFNVDESVKDPGYRTRVFGRGGRRFVNGPRERGGYSRGRQFDRQSGSDKTGVKPIDKREGSGAHNWGSANRTDDLMAEGAGEQEVDVSAGNEETAQQKPEDYQQNGGEFEQTGEQQQQQQGEEAEPEPVQLTLDEWKALQQRSKPAFNVRRAGEGEKEKAEWKKLVPLKGGDEAGKKKKKSKKEEIVVDEDEEEEDFEEAQKIVPIDINFIGDSYRGGRGRGRGMGGRGGGGRGAFGGGRGGGPGFGRGMDGGGRGGGVTRDRGATDVPYTIDDETFPSLK